MTVLITVASRASATGPEIPASTVLREPQPPVLRYSKTPMLKENFEYSDKLVFPVTLLKFAKINDSTTAEPAIQLCSGGRNDKMQLLRKRIK